MEFLAIIDWSVVLQIILIDILLGGDNAVIIALACRNLHPNQRRAGILWGTAGAIGLRIILTIFAVTLLQIPYLKVVGAILLLWIGYKLMVDNGGHDANDLEAPDKLFAAIKTIIVADFVMSLDNVLAIAGAAGQVDDQSHQFGYIVFGLIVSVPIIIACSRLVLFLIDRFPIIVTAGAGLLGWIAGGMLMTDPGVVKHFGESIQEFATMASIAGALGVMAVGELAKRRRKKEH
jgi:YjbE family integral membrane protein